MNFVSQPSLIWMPPIQVKNERLTPNITLATRTSGHRDTFYASSGSVWLFLTCADLILTTSEQTKPRAPFVWIHEGLFRLRAISELRDSHRAEPPAPLCGAHALAEIPRSLKCARCK